MKIKIISTLILAFLSVTSAYAGTEDWNGTYKVKVSETETWDVVHTPTYAKIMFFTTGKCIHLGKGVKINGVVIKEDVDFCVSANVPNFTNEVQKLGTILSKKVTLGPTYTEKN